MNVRLVAYRPEITNSGVVVNNPGSTYPVSATETTIAVDGVDATTIFLANQILVDSTGTKYGVIKTVVGANSITLLSVQTAIPDNAELYYKPQTEFEFDLIESPSIVVNFNFLDIKEPTLRKGSFSQTIKVPFSNRNNKFFENWFNVNLDTLIFDTNTKFDAIVFVDTMEQMQGFIQLKSIYLNAREYEIVIFGNTANFFTDIKDKKLRQAFENDNNGIITSDEQLDHYLTSANVVDSWTSPGLTTIGTNPVGGASTSNDIMYPVIDYGHNSKPFGMGMFTDRSDVTQPIDIEQLANIGFVKTANLRPAIRLSRLLRIIAEKAGYTIKSSFLGINLDGTLDLSKYFSKIFMTLSNQHERVKTFYNNFGFQVSMAGAVTQTIGADEDDYASQIVRQLGFTNESSPNFDYFSMFYYNPLTAVVDGTTYNIQTNRITIPSTYVASEMGLPEGYGSNWGVEYEFNITAPSSYLQNSTGSYKTISQVIVYVQKQTNPFGEPSGSWVTCSTNTASPGSTINIQGNTMLYGLQTGGVVNFRLKIIWTAEFGNVFDNDTMPNLTVNSGTIRSINNGATGYTNGSYGMQVVMAENMPDIKQADLFRDLVHRFNLVVLNDPDNANNLIIEPYQEYIASGSTQYWTDKLDISKEQVIKSTSELQKEKFIFSDLLGDDHLNKSFNNNFEKVYGEKVVDGGDFSSGEGKNYSLMVPFITQGITEQPSLYSWGNDYSNLDVAVGQLYSVDEYDPIELSPITDGKPRLFYYSGTPIDLAYPYSNPLTNTAFKFHIVGYSLSTSQDTNDKFPLCTQYDLDNLNTGITSATKQLFWDWQSPIFNSPWWCSKGQPFGNELTEKGYFYQYWSQYFNEIYNSEARIMECYLNLTAADIKEFEAESFKNPVYIKNTLWRILKIEQHLVGGNKSTKVTLIKALEKLNYDCSSIPDSFNADGTITFVNPADGTTEVNPTQECCEGTNSDWTWYPLDDNSFTGTCYHNLDIEIVDDSVSDVTGLVSAQTPVMLPMLGSTNTLVEMNNKIVTSQSSTILLECVSVGTDITTLKTQDTVNMLNLAPYTMAYVELDLIGTIVKGSSNLGATFYGKYDAIIKRKLRYSYDGTDGGTFIRKTEGTGFPTTPTVDLTEFDDTNFSFTVASSSANYTIKWVAKVQFIAQKLRGVDGEDVYQSLALFQNGSVIAYENGVDALEWN